MILMILFVNFHASVWRAMPIKDTWSVVQKSKLHTLRIAVVIFTVFTVGRGGGAELWRCETSRAETGVCGHKIARTAQPAAAAKNDGKIMILKIFWAWRNLMISLLEPACFVCRCKVSCYLWYTSLLSATINYISCAIGAKSFYVSTSINKTYFPTKRLWLCAECY